MFNMESSTQENFLENTFGQPYPSRKIPWFLYFTSLTADLLLVSFGSGLAWSSPVLPKLRSNDSTINPLGEPITTIQTALVASIPLASSTMAHFVWAKLTDKLGRKSTMQIIATTAICGSIGIAFGTNIYIYYIFLSIFGLSLSGDIVTVVVYNNEIAEDSNRGRLSCLAASFVSIGMLFSYIFGAVTNVKNFTLICAGPSFLYLLLSPFLPESPTYLIAKNKRLQAYRVLEKLKRTKCCQTLNLEYEKLENAVNKGTRGMPENFWTRSTIKAFLQGFLGVASQQVSGILVVNYYVGLIFNEAESGLSGDAVGIIVGIVQILTYFLIAIFIKKIGKRKLMLFSSAFCSIPMFFLGLYFYFKHIELPIFDGVRWIAIVFVILYIISYGLGMGPIPLGLTGEFFKENTRAFGSALVFTANDFLVAGVVFGFPLIAENYGIYTSFWMHSFACLAAFVCLYFFFFETEGKTLIDVQNMINK